MGGPLAIHPTIIIRTSYRKVRKLCLLGTVEFWGNCFIGHWIIALGCQLLGSCYMLAVLRLWKIRKWFAISQKF